MHGVGKAQDPGRDVGQGKKEAFKLVDKDHLLGTAQTEEKVEWGNRKDCTGFKTGKLGQGIQRGRVRTLRGIR